ncbi:MAG: hypothetical protein KKF46_06480 [Nanoarchaeota archaeon]|nr:hypothetical protein [Nanoarchaeota archaeon]MBU1321975.1 hypothetical protein [Nanoarchaeota archaeon]MBU1598211.1 hypothetical protein [Nanoarchaeota archaeon]MBU2441116.1 hypothetical protein [Nanoarchaeota archaeon]
MKKANLQTFVSIIVVLLIFVVLLAFFGPLKELILKTSERALCQASVSAQALTNILPAGDKAVSLDCKTYQVEFFEDHVDINDKKEEVYIDSLGDKTKKFDHLTDEVVNRVVAEELKWCWYEFLEGKKSLFGIADLFPWSSEKACFVCSEIVFDESVSQEEFTGFFEYTKEKTMLDSKITPFKDSDKTYYEYYAEEFRRYSPFYDRDDGEFAWEEYTDGIEVIIKIIDISHCGDWISIATPADNRPKIEKNIVFNTSLGKKYVVFFVREGKTSKSRKAQEYVKPVDEGCAPETYFAYVLPFEDLDGQCSTLRRGGMK